MSNSGLKVIVSHSKGLKSTQTKIDIVSTKIEVKKLQIFCFLLFLIVISTSLQTISANGNNNLLNDSTMSQSLPSINPAEIFNSTDLERFTSWIQHISINAGPRPVNSSGNYMAMTWIESGLAAFNPKCLHTEIIGSSNSVLGVLPGKYHDVSGKCVVIGAHFDTCPCSPGANDNAGGVSLVLEAARVLSSYPHQFNYDIFFVGFNGEECGLQGSIDILDHLISIEKEVVLCLVADMILFDDPCCPKNQKQGFFYKSDKIFGTMEKYQEWGNFCVRISQIYGDGICYTGPTDIFHADQGYFWHLGYPALLAHSGCDSCYHCQNDTLENPELNLKYALETVSTITTAAALVAEYSHEILETTDTDQDGLDNQLEIILGTSRLLPDTDNDGVTDYMEYLAGSNPLDQNSTFFYSAASLSHVIPPLYSLVPAFDLNAISIALICLSFFSFLQGGYSLRRRIKKQKENGNKTS